MQMRSNKGGEKAECVSDRDGSSEHIWETRYAPPLPGHLLKEERCPALSGWSGWSTTVPACQAADPSLREADTQQQG